MTPERILPKSFQELILTSEKPILVDFYAEWCEPCRAFHPEVTQIAKEFADTLITVRIDTDRKPMIAEECQVTSIPSLLLFWKGKTILRMQGNLPYDKIRGQIEQHLPCSCRLERARKAAESGAGSLA